ncbi:MAG: NAD(P)-dependent oxidoreductase [Candidatus Omnitrophica bacterium]|nr:NAD(P)-dependent oxidoreductase [Candidatus Omnitrophota bacterium]
MNIAITGGAGFLGSYLARNFSAENHVTVIDIHSPNPVSGVDFKQCDIRDAASLEGALSAEIDLVIHCAAVIKIQNDGRCPNGMVDVNLQATINLMETMVNKNIGKLIFCSSMTVYAADNASPVKENARLDPIHFYGLSKKWGEDAIAAYANKGLIKALILRYPGLYGYPRRAGYIYNVAKKLINNELVLVDSTGLKFWETIYVGDASQLTKKIATAYDWSSNLEIINCSYGQETDFVMTASKIKAVLGSSSKIEIKEPKDYVKFYLDNSKLKNITGSFDYNFDGGLKMFLGDNLQWAKR